MARINDEEASWAIRSAADMLRHEARDFIKVVKTYWAIANDQNDSNRGIRVTVVAPNIEAAERLLIEKYGVGNFVDLHGEEEASKVR